ncbi:MAG: DUF433 domain-containing protein [Gallionella sp.]
MRITVYDVLEMLATGLSTAEISEDFPELQAENRAVCLSFTANREHNLSIRSTQHKVAAGRKPISTHASFINNRLSGQFSDSIAAT